MEDNGLSWHVGDVRITTLIERLSRFPCEPTNPLVPMATRDAMRRYAWLYPHFVTEDDLVVMPIQAFVIEAPAVTLIIDTCIGNDKPRVELNGASLATGFLDDLNAAGFVREAIDAVICTHLHFDHVGWNTMLQEGAWVPTFPNARYLFGRAEYEHWSLHGEAEAAKGHPMDHFADSIVPVVEAGLVDLVEMDQRISDEIRLVPTPGHTPGHVSVLIESQGKRAVVTGDMIHHPCQIAEPDWGVPFDSDQAAAARMRWTRLGEWAEGEVMVIGSHFAAPTAGWVRREGASFRFEISHSVE